MRLIPNVGAVSFATLVSAERLIERNWRQNSAGLGSVPRRHIRSNHVVRANRVFVAGERIVLFNGARRTTLIKGPERPGMPCATEC